MGGHFQALCVLYGIGGGIQIVVGALLAIAVFGVAAVVGTTNFQPHGKSDQGLNDAQHSATMMIMIVGMIPVVLTFCAATFLCCAMHYAHQVTTYLAVEGRSIEELTTNKASARESLVAPLVDGESYERLV